MRRMSHFMLIDEDHHVYIGNSFTSVADDYAGGDVAKLGSILNVLTGHPRFDLRVIIFFEDGSHLNSFDDDMSDYSFGIVEQKKE